MKIIKYICLITAALMLAVSLSSCSENPKNTDSQVTTADYTCDGNVSVSQYDKASLEQTEALADWLEKCGDDEHSMIENYAIYSKQQNGDKIRYTYIIYRPACAGKKLSVSYSALSTEKTYSIELDYSDDANGGDCEIIGMSFEADADKRISVSVSDNGESAIGIISTNAGDSDITIN